MTIDMAKFLARFVEEAREHITRLNQGLFTLEKTPGDSRTLDAVFRSAHTIKGSSKMMKLIRITEVAHRMEDVLDALREKKICYSKPLADLLFKGIDAISEIVENVAAGREVRADNQALCEELERASKGLPEAQEAGIKQTGETVVSDMHPPADTAVLERSLPEEDKRQEDRRQRDRRPETETIRVNAGKLDDLIKLMGEIISNQGRLKQRLSEVRGLESVARKKSELLAGLGRSLATANKEGALDILHDHTKAVRSLYQNISGLYIDLKDDVNIQELLNNELHEKALMMRMVPLSVVFDTLYRLPRDLSNTLGKEVDLVIEGGDIELDKKIVERIADPLVHMLRNSIDHGIETPAERREAGKPERGSIRLSATCEAGSVLISLSDDGAGIPLKKIRERALRKKLMEEKIIENMSAPELIDLIFHPGFSTSNIITELSGRGVGMDVVRRNIVEGLRGSITVETSEGRGTSFHIRLPMSLAIMRVLLISASDKTIAVPVHYISEILSTSEEDLIDVVDKKAIRLRSEIIPVIEVSVLLNLPSARLTIKNRLLVIVVRLGNEKLGLIADALLDEKDAVIKPFPAHLKNLKLVSGVIIADNNEIINVIHVPAIVESAQRMKGRSLREGSKEEETPINILVVDDSLNTREIEKGILESYGYRVSVAEDGLDAIGKASEFKYDLIITDIEMPNLDGFSLTERLRNNADYKNTPIVIMTSREREEDKRRGIKAGADAYIIKGSFDQTNLLDTVRNLVG
jgi:two-component system chemotaxis sensor kinase CheA